MRTRLGQAVAALALAAWGAVPMAAGPASAQPRDPSAYRAATAADCRSEGGRLRLEPGFERKADFNGDGRPDILFDSGKADCVGGGINPNCGSAGCTLTIFVSTPAGYVTGYNSNVRDFEIRRQGDRDLLVLALHGSACGRVGAASCDRVLGWDGRAFRVDAAAGAPAGGGRQAGAAGGQPAAAAAQGGGPLARRWCAEMNQYVEYRNGTLVIDSAGSALTVRGVAFAGCGREGCIYRSADGKMRWAVGPNGPRSIRITGPVGSSQTRPYPTATLTFDACEPARQGGDR